MKKSTRTLIVMLVVSAAVLRANAGGATLSIDKVQQRYPWNGLVDIDYTVASDEGVTLGVDDNLEVLMVDKSVVPAVTNRAISFLQAPLPITDGKHRITWDANADGVTNYTERAVFIVKIAHYVPAYMVINVSGGATTNVYPVDFLNGEPIGGFNASDYKGNKIVLRRIHPGSYMAGSPTTEKNRNANREKQHRVAISQPFYIGVFEVTQKQYENVTGANPSGLLGDDRPVEKVSYNTIRGTKYSWPQTNAVLDTSFMGLLRSKCRAKDDEGGYTVKVDGFDLPTEFQWEYACRAGTTGAFNTTNSYANTTDGQKAALATLGRYSGNMTDGHGDYSDAHTNVGKYDPNQWGLYDMHGNVMEWCLDWSNLGHAADLKQYVDPKGATTGSHRMALGGTFARDVGDCRSGFVYELTPGSEYTMTGFRLAITLP